MRAEERLLTRDFLIMNLIYFFAFVNMAAFFQFHRYILTLPVDPASSGLLIGVFSLVSIAVQPILSPFIHAKNGKAGIVAGLAMMLGSLLSYSMGRDLPSLFAIRIIHGCGFVVQMTALTATIAAMIPGRQSGRAFGYLSFSMLLPYAVVPPILDAVGPCLGPFPVILRYTALLMILPMVLVFFVRVPGGQAGGEEAPGRRIAFREVVEDLRDYPILALLVLNLLVYGAYTPTFFYLQGFGLAAGIRNPGAFFTIAILTMILIRLLGAPRFDRMPKVRLACGSLGLLSVGYLLFPAVTGPGLFFGLALIFGVAWGVAIPLFNALMFDLSPPLLRGLNLNLALVMTQAGFFLGPLAGGMVLARRGYGALFFLCALICLTALGLALTLRPAPGSQRKGAR